ncbi:MAG TPA: hypothetical protein VD884_17525 [Ohtaekwangia sp.]|nr:hypothetical protein [Ohtaekwangia sp.]
MNYIKHLSAFFDKVSGDLRFNPSHIALYMSLFQLWNRNMFKSPISINRSELMLISKISSKGTYHKCIKELHNYGYIRYSPSYNPFRGSWVYMFNFEASAPDEGQSEIQASIGLVINVHKTSDRQALGPYINVLNNKNLTNNKNEGGETPARVDLGNELIEKTPGTLEAVRKFFREENFPDVEAEKFFNHFKGNGWQIAGKTPMQDWKASARSWILKMPNYPARNGTGSQPDQSLNNVNYDEPL